MSTQIIVIVAYIIWSLAFEQFIFVSYLVRPAKAQGALRRLRQLLLAHRQELLVAIFAVVGIAMLVQGLGGI